jgi:Protein of unknown function (DUF3592)
MSLTVIGLLLAAAGALVAAWGAQTGIDAYRLNAGGVRSEAQVQDMRITRPQSGKNPSVAQHQVRYSFSVPKDDTTYRAEDDIFLIEQDDVWVEVPERTFEASRESGRIAIEYLRSDPSLNQPVAARRGYVGAGLFVMLGLAMFVLGLLLTRGGLRRVQPAR